MPQIYDLQMANVSGFDQFSPVVFESLKDYEKMKQDRWYKDSLVVNHARVRCCTREQVSAGLGPLPVTSNKILIE